MKKLLLVLATTISFFCHAQIVFEKGYFVRNSGEKTETLIKNMDWYNNPTKITYKNDTAAAENEITIADIKEFGIYNGKKYIRSAVKIDRSKEGILELTPGKDPIYTDETLFLEVLVEGKGTLYFYKEHEVEKYFYNVDSGSIEQLIFKNYLDKPYNGIRSNKQYQIQLWNALKCPDFTMKMLEKLDYTEDDLVGFFNKYNKCNNSESVVLEQKTRRDWFNLTIRPGLSYSSLTLENVTIYNIDFEKKLSFRLGAEAEIIMGFNKGKWALIVEPTYTYFKSTASYLYQSNTPKTASVDYKSLELPLGIRHYFFLKNDSKIFINAFLVPELDLGSTIFINDNKTEMSVETAVTFAVGLGYKLRNKYSLEFRQTMGKSVLASYEPAWESSLTTSSLIFGYTLF